jgi:hypothetical protein
MPAFTISPVCSPHKRSSRFEITSKEATVDVIVGANGREW